MEPREPLKNLSDLHRKDSDPSKGYVTVLTVDPVRHTATVIDSSNRVLPDLPILREAGPDGEGDFSTPMPGWLGSLTNRLGYEALEHCFPKPSYFSEGRPPEDDDYEKALNTWLSLTGSSGPYRRIEHANTNFRSHRPYDLLAGDLGFRTAEGASVFALRGGVAGIKVDELCQILFNQVDHLTRLVSRQVEIMTDAGLLEFENNGGKTKLRAKLNSQASNTYSDKFEFDFTLGDGTSFMNWELRTKDTKTPVATLKLNQAGTQIRFLKGDEIARIHGKQGVAISGNQKLIVGGNQEMDVDGTSVDRIGGKKTIYAPKVHLGDETGEKAPMGEQLVRYLGDIIFWLNNQAMFMTPMGPTTPGAFMFQAPAVPDLLSRVVDYTQDPADSDPDNPGEL